MTAIVLGATGNVGGCIVRLLIDNPRCEKVIVVTRRKTHAHPKVSQGLSTWTAWKRKLRRTSNK